MDSITFLTGAGMSTDAGIPDFRGPAGVWTRTPDAARLLELDAYLDNPEVRRASWRARAASPMWEAEPTPAHRALVDVERAGRLGGIITQNIDGLHQRAGSSPDKVAELHGSIHTTLCWECGRTWPTREVLRRLSREDDPPCEVCGGILKTSTVFFGQEMPGDAMERSWEMASGCEVFVVIGSSLTVEPAASYTAVAAQHGARVIIINAQPTPYDDLAVQVVRGPIQEEVPRLVRGLLAPS